MENRTHSERRRLSPQAFERTLVAAAQRLTSRLSVSAVCEALAESTADLVGAGSCAVLLREHASSAVRCAYATGRFTIILHDTALPMDEADSAGMVLARGQSLFAPDSSISPSWTKGGAATRRPEPFAVLYVPLQLHGQVLGILMLESPYLSRRTPPRADDLARLSALAAQASIALSNARYFEESERDRHHLSQLLEDRRRLRGRVHELSNELRAVTFDSSIIGASGALRQVLSQVEIVARAEATVLLLGETGTGKELLARAIHERSRRRRHPFVAVNCAAFPEALVESELFGHERGAFTDAITSKPGRFEAAHQGTLFLDEVGDLPHNAQAKMLRALQEREVQRVGATTLTKVDVKIIAATNMDLRIAVAEGRFRADLYYRLAVFPITLPPLRERPEDIPPLASHFVRHFAGRSGKVITDIEPSALDRLIAYRWPGNVRELQNVIERAVILTHGRVITSDALAIEPSWEAADRPTALSLSDAQRRTVLAALRRANWRISGAGGAADLLGLKPTTLHARLKKLGVRRP